jgi:hypothetical protein
VALTLSISNYAVLCRLDQVVKVRPGLVLYCVSGAVKTHTPLIYMATSSHHLHFSMPKREVLNINALIADGM